MSTTAEFLSQQHLHFINGDWVKGNSKKVFIVSDPATEKTLASIQQGTTDDIDAAVSAARAAFDNGWKTTAPAIRTNILNNFSRLVAEHAQLLAEVETFESGTPLSWTLPTMQFGFPSFLSYYAGWPTKIMGDTIPTTPLGREDQEFLVYTQKEPVGVVGMITPWNSPAGICLMKLAPALAAGCTAVIKPPELAPLTTSILVKLADEAGLPPGVINMVHGDGAIVGQHLAEHQDIDKISFTGSTRVGKIILESAKTNLKKVSLELGGKSPFVVLADANLDLAAPAAAMACFGMSGQNCMAGTRVFIHKDVKQEFLKKLDTAIDMLKVGNGFEEDVFIGPLISSTQNNRVLEYIQVGKDEGATLHRGGNSLDPPGHWIEPTVFTNCKHQMRIVREEIFGPVMVVVDFDNDRESFLTALNDTDYGLSGSVWSKNIATALEIAKHIDSGQVAINAHAAISAETPFGGNRQSGWGRELGREGLDEYLKTKAISIRIDENYE